MTPTDPTPDLEQDERDAFEVAAMVQRVRDFLGDAPDDLPFSRTVQDPTPWGTMEAREEETPLTAADLRAMCDVVEILAEKVAALADARAQVAALTADRERLNFLAENGLVLTGRNVPLADTGDYSEAWEVRQQVMNGPDEVLSSDSDIRAALDAARSEAR
jgi:hypothetical protein